LEEKNMKRGPMSKTKIMPKCEREEKAFTQIQNLSLGPKPFPNCMKLIKQREGRESLKGAKPRRGLDVKNHSLVNASSQTPP
jgi:hypothetical protein